MKLYSTGQFGGFGLTQQSGLKTFKVHANLHVAKFQTAPQSNDILKERKNQFFTLQQKDCPSTYLLTYLLHGAESFLRS
jgi:hypothetical protein